MNHNNIKSYRDLDCLLLTRPQFFGIDDDLKDPTDEQVAFHRRMLTILFRRHWSQPTPWELQDDGNAAARIVSDNQLEDVLQKLDAQQIKMNSSIGLGWDELIKCHQQF